MDNSDLKELTVSQLVRMVEGLRADNTSKTQQVDNIENRLEASRREIDELKEMTKKDREKLEASSRRSKRIKELTIQNDGLSGAIDKKEKLISTLQRLIPNLKKNDEQLRKRNGELVKQCAAAKQNLINMEVSGKAEAAICKSEKKRIAKTLGENISSLNERVDELSKEKKEDKLTMEKSNLEKRKWKLNMEALQKINKKQQENLQSCKAEHEQVVNRFAMAKETLKNELEMKKAECKLLGKKLEEKEKVLDAMRRLAKGKPRPKSPVGKVLNSEKFAEVATLQSATVENCEKVMTDGKLNPKAFAAKLKLLF